MAELKEDLKKVLKKLDKVERGIENSQIKYADKKGIRMLKELIKEQNQIEDTHYTARALR